jgi:3-methyladenine DNA glycosylase Tag
MEPKKIKPRSLADYLEVLTKPVFQAGISWRVVEAKWDGLREAFHGFDPEWVASLSPRGIDRIAKDPKVIRNRRKIEGTVDNARTMLELDAEYGGFRRYLRSFGDFESVSRDLRRRFRFVGDHGAYQFLWVVGEKVPSYQDWTASQGRSGQPLARARAARAARS